MTVTNVDEENRSLDRLRHEQERLIERDARYLSWEQDNAERLAVEQDAHENQRPEMLPLPIYVSNEFTKRRRLFTYED